MGLQDTPINNVFFIYLFIYYQVQLHYASQVRTERCLSPSPPDHEQYTTCP